MAIDRLSKSYTRHGKSVCAVRDVSLAIQSGETLGLVGESGCGKSTVSRLLLLLEPPTSGDIHFLGRSLLSMSKHELFHFRSQVQLIFQDPYASLNPKHTVGEILKGPLAIHRQGSNQERLARVEQLIDQVGLSRSALYRFPHELSGGQRQRVGIARALSLQPRLLICDEPISSLDVSVQGQIVNLLRTLREEMGLTLLFIAHDLAMVQYISTRVAVMYLGQLVEIAPSRTLYKTPLHPYTQALLSSIPIPDPTAERKRTKILLQGDPPSTLEIQQGCPFRSRCRLAEPRCALIAPPLRQVAPDHHVACHLVSESSQQSA